MAPEPPLSKQLADGWRLAADWVSGHSSRIALAVLASIAIILLLYTIKRAGRWLASSPVAWRAVIGRALAAMRFWFMAALAVQLVSRFALAPAEIAEPVRLVFIIAATFQAALILRELILGSVELRAGEADPSGNLGSAIGLIRLLVNVVLFVVATILILSNIGVNVTGLVAGLGIGGIAIGLAAQGIFADLFAALSILFDKPFRRGDAVSWDQTQGTVEAIGLKSTRIRAVTGEEIIISNTNLLAKELRNFARLEQRRVVQLLSLVHHTPVALCTALPDKLAAAINAVPGCRFVRCGLDSFAASSLDFRLMYDVDAEDQEQLLLHKHAANLEILKLFEAEGLSFAYPTQTTFTAAPDGTLVMPWAAPPK